MRRFSAIFNKGENLSDFLYLPAHQLPSEKVSMQKGKSLLPF